MHFRKTKPQNYLILQSFAVLEDSFLLNKVFRYDIKGKKMLQTLNKFFVADTGFLLAILGRNAQINRGHLLENLVFIELKCRYKEIYIGKFCKQNVILCVKTTKDLSPIIKFH